MSDRITAGAGIVAASHPDVRKAYEALSAATSHASGLNEREPHLFKLALAIGAVSEGVTHSQVRRGIAGGISQTAIDQVVLLAIGPCSLPRAVAALT